MPGSFLGPPIITSEGDSPLDANVVWLEHTKTKPLRRFNDERPGLGGAPSQQDWTDKHVKEGPKYDYVSDKLYTPSQPVMWDGKVSIKEVAIGLLVLTGAIMFIQK